MEIEEIRDEVLSALNEVGYSREDVVFIFLFGSYGTEDFNQDLSDVDICIDLDVERTEEAVMKIDGRLPQKYDVSVFEQLPLYINKKVFEETLLYARSKDEVYDKVFATLRDFESFEPLYKEAIGAK